MILVGPNKSHSRRKIKKLNKALKAKQTNELANQILNIIQEKKIIQKENNDEKTNEQPEIESLRDNLRRVQRTNTLIKLKLKNYEELEKEVKDIRAANSILKRMYEESKKLASIYKNQRNEYAERLVKLGHLKKNVPEYTPTEALDKEKLSKICEEIDAWAEKYKSITLITNDIK